MNELAKLQAIESEMNRLLVGRRDEVRGVIVSILARQHAIFFGPHGEAKSMLLDMFAAAVDGAKVFTITFAQDTMPSDLFEAGHDFVTETETLPDGTVRQRQYAEPLIEGTMSDAHFVMGREIFRGNSATLNTTLTAVNERYYVVRGQRRPMPLVSFFGDTNNLPGEDLEAFYDRFLLRYVVDRTHERSLRLEMRRLSEARRKGKPEGKFDVEHITLENIETLQEKARMVEVPERIDELIEEIIERLYDEGIIIYGRRDVRLNTLLKANAFLEGRDEVSEADLVEILPHALWDDPDDRRKVKAIVLAVANPIGKVVQELLDEALELRDNALKNQNADGSEKTPQQKMSGCMEASTKLKKLITGDSRDEDFKGVEKLLEDARRNNEPTNLIQEALKTIQRYQQDVYKAATGK